MAIISSSDHLFHGVHYYRMHTLHTHQHRLDKSHNLFLLLIPGLIFMVVIGVYLILRVQEQQVRQSEVEAQSMMVK